MNIKRLIYAAGFTFVSICFVNAFSPDCSHARKMTVDWGMPTEAAQGDGSESAHVIATQADALNTAIVRAATEEALALLPQNMSASQKSALRRYVASKAPTLVRGYHEESVTMLPSGQQRLVVDVNVDKQWLVDALQQLGAYYLAGHEALPCTLYYLGQTAGEKTGSTYKKAANYVALLSTAAGLQSHELSFLTTAELAEKDGLAGAEQSAPVMDTPVTTGMPTVDTGASANPDDAIAEALNAAKMSTGVMQGQSGQVDQSAQPMQASQAVSQTPNRPKSLRFILVPQGKDAWSGKLQGPDYSAEAEGSTIDMVWGKLWPAYLSTRYTRTESTADASSLQVWGWSSADGVVAFDKAMRQWYQNQGVSIKDLDLLQMNMQAGAVKAVWRVDSASQNKLKAFVRDYASQRRLRYEFVNLSTGLNGAQ